MTLLCSLLQWNKEAFAQVMVGVGVCGTLRCLRLPIDAWLELTGSAGLTQGRRRHITHFGRGIQEVEKLSY
jgi:hypothetical protein